MPLTDEEASTTPFYRFSQDSEEYKYLIEKRNKLGGSLPYRNQKASKLNIPDISIFQEMLDGSGEREVSTTMSYVRFLTLLSKDKTIGKHVVPIVPDEARTLGWILFLDNWEFIPMQVSYTTL